MNHTAKRCVTLAVIVLSRTALAADPLVFNPLSDPSTTVTLGRDGTYGSGSLALNNVSDTGAKVFWFRFHADGLSTYKFDTLGSNFGTASGGVVLAATNQSQVAVYKANGEKVAISKGTVGLDGNPRAIYPYYTNVLPYNPNGRFLKWGTDWYTPQGLSEVYFQPNAPTNPKWSVSPNDPNPYTGWYAPPLQAGVYPAGASDATKAAQDALVAANPQGNIGNGQKYYPPSYYVSLNEYQVWSTALSPVVLNGDGTTYDSDPATPGIQQVAQPGWRYYDRRRAGPGSTWNRYNTLDEGDYYVAIASYTPVFAGDGPSEELLRAPINSVYDPDTNTIAYNVPLLTAPMTSSANAIQYFYASGSTPYFGTINLNVAGSLTIGTGYTTIQLLSGSRTVNTPTFVASSSTITVGSGSSLTTTTITSLANVSPVVTVTGGGTVTATDVISIPTGTVSVTGGSSLIIAGPPNANTVAQVATVGGITVSGAGSKVVVAATDRSVNQQRVVVTSGFTATGGGSLDLTNNDLIIRGGDLNSVRASLASWYSGGSYGGTSGLISSVGGKTGAIPYTALAVFQNLGPSGLPYFTTFDGVSVSASDILVKYTYIGDTNLDGMLDGRDFKNVFEGFATGQSGWQWGDVDYSGGPVSAADVQLFLRAYDAYKANPIPLGGSLDNGAASQQAIPEPSLCMWIAPMGVMLRRRRRDAMA
jgi:hypothetical protein